MERSEIRLIATGVILTSSMLASIAIRRLMQDAVMAGRHMRDQEADPDITQQVIAEPQPHITELNLDRLPTPSPDYSRSTPTVLTAFSGTQSQRGDDTDLIGELAAAARAATDLLNTRQQG